MRRIPFCLLFLLTTVALPAWAQPDTLLADRVLVMEDGRIAADCTPAQLIAGEGGVAASALVAVPREQARRLRALEAGV